MKVVDQLNCKDCSFWQNLPISTKAIMQKNDLCPRRSTLLGCDIHG